MLLNGKEDSEDGSKEGEGDAEPQFEVDFVTVPRFGQQKEATDEQQFSDEEQLQLQVAVVAQ